MITTKKRPSQDEMYEALLARDSTYDGLFFVGVKTTGIFCWPTCPAKKPRLENVEFFDSSRDAIHAGYRACRRCAPMDLHRKPPAWVTALFDRVQEDPGGRLHDRDLRGMGIDPARARRYFSDHYGMTFHAYHRARRMGLALAEIRKNNGVVNGVAHRYGFDSESGFREAFVRVFGRPPGQGINMPCLFAKWLDTPLGAMLALASDEGLCLLEFVDRRMLETQLATIRRRTGAAIVPGDHPHLEKTADELTRYFDGKLTRFTVPIQVPGSDFQRAVWDELRRIPYGKTSTYARIAEAVGRPDAQRAVGRANGENRIAIIIPCHRVIRSDGTLSGYGGGVWRKKWLLDLESRFAKS